MFRDLTLIVPLGFAAALSPMMLTEQTVLLAGRGGRRSASRYALGTALVTTVYLGVLVLWGHAISLPKRPTLSASMDIVAGVLLVLLGVAIQIRHPAKPEKPTRTEMGPRAAFGFGVFSMATNFTSLAVLLPAAKDVAADVTNVIGRVALIAVLVVLATMPAWVPLAATGVAPGTAKRGLDWLSNLISHNGRRITVILIAALGFVLIARGCWHLLR
jgi:threonine/homoserine/homoserine lactone efflux protein